MFTLKTLARLAGILVLAAPGLTAAAGAPDPKAASGEEILTEASNWRCFVTCKTPVLRVDKELKDAGDVSCASHGGKGAWRADTALPPDNWTAPDFDDSSWSRWRDQYSPAMALLCLRGKFLVNDPAQVQDLKLNLSCRGGVVVYVNGQEIARQHLPKTDRPDPLALAEDYPPEVFLSPQGKPLNAEAGDYQKFKDRVALRYRKLPEVAIPAAALRKGVNVLAVECHRAPYFGDGLGIEDMNNVTVWATGGLAGVRLQAAAGVTPNVAKPKGVRVWNVSTMDRLVPARYGDPNERLLPLQMVGVRNGRFTAKVAVSSDGALKGLRASAADIKAKDGKGAIPSSAIQVFYATRDDKMTLRNRPPEGGFWDTLSATPPAEVPAFKSQGATVAVWFKVSVPADAAPGDYEGTLTVSAEGLAPTAVPVKLKVIDWRLPDPKDYAAHMGILQSPDSVALCYKVPQWSEEHWQLMAKSFVLMAELGSEYLWLPLITRTNFGNEQSIVRWVKDGSGYKYDFTVFDRYVDLALKHLKPDVVNLYVCDPKKYLKRAGDEAVARRDIPRVSLLDPATGAITEIDGPAYASPEAEAFWKPVLAEVRGRLEKRGLGKALMVGMTGDVYPTKEQVALFQKVAPGLPWVQNSHPAHRGGNVHGVPVGYDTFVYLNLFQPPGGSRKYGWRDEKKEDLFCRPNGPATLTAVTPTGPLGNDRVIVEAAFMSGCSGLGRCGADFWPILGKESLRPGIKHSTTITARYPESCWDQLNMDRATEAVLAPGPEGALPTERFEMFREGVQEAEARAFIEKAILDGKLEPALAKKCQEVLDERAWTIRAACMAAGWAWFEMAGSTPLSEKLYAAAAEVAARLK